LGFPRQETFGFWPTIKDSAVAAVTFFVYVKVASEYRMMKRMELPFQLLMSPPQIIATKESMENVDKFL
jgi:hypothetical protein